MHLEKEVKKHKKSCLCQMFFVYLLDLTTQKKDMDNFSAELQIILDILQQIEDTNNLNRQIRKPKLSDLELIAIDLTADTWV